MYEFSRTSEWCRPPYSTHTYVRVNICTYLVQLILSSGVLPIARRTLTTCEYLRNTNIIGYQVPGMILYEAESYPYDGSDEKQRT